MCECREKIGRSIIHGLPKQGVCREENKNNHLQSNVLATRERVSEGFNVSSSGFDASVPIVMKKDCSVRREMRYIPHALLG